MLIHQPRWLPAYNGGSQEVPAFGLVEITDAEYDFETPTTPSIVLKVKRPTSDSLRQFAVNSWMPIAVGKTGLVSFDGPLIVSHASAMSVGDTFGTGTDVFTPDTAETGMYVIASLGSNRYLCDFLKGTGYKPLVRFSLDAALAKADASKSATIEFQVGPGTDHDALTTITVKNPADATNGNNTYAGAIGATGWAVWDTGTEFHIIDMDCEA